MEYRRFGRTGMKVSVIGLGCGGFGGIGSVPDLFGKGEDQETAFALMDRAWEVGINYFDTANSYGGGASETMIGTWLCSRNQRDKVVLSTKVGNLVGPGPNDRGLSRGHILEQVDASLRRLQTDYLDLYVIHAPDADTPLDETLEAMDDLVRAGKVRYLGASNLAAWQLCKSLWISDRHQLHRFESIQNSYSLLDREVESEVLPLSAEEQIAVTPYSPTAGGLLSGKYRDGQAPPDGSRIALRPEPYTALLSDQTFRAIDVLKASAAERGVEPITLALAWVLSHPQVTAALIGPRRVEHFPSLLAAYELKLTPTERTELSDRMRAA